MTNAGLKHLAGLKQLRRLFLYYNKVTDAGLEHLTGLKQVNQRGQGTFLLRFPHRRPRDAQIKYPVPFDFSPVSGEKQP